MIRIHIFHTGSVIVDRSLPYKEKNPLAPLGVFRGKDKKVELPVSAYLIEHPKGKILVDCGWHRDMSPTGAYDKKAQIRSLGSRILYFINQGRLGKGEAIDEQLSRLGIKPSELDYVLLTHLDCDHVSGLKLVSDAKRILVAADEVKCALAHPLRFQRKWWDGVEMTEFEWNSGRGAFQKSYDLFGDNSVVLINIPGHSAGLFAVKLSNLEGNYILLYSDGGYSTKSWRDMIPPGISLNRKKQRRSLAWIREQSLCENCLGSFANHDPEVNEQIIEL